MMRYLLVQPYAPQPWRGAIVESFDAIDDAFEALDLMAERLHEQGIDPESLGSEVRMSVPSDRATEDARCSNDETTYESRVRARPALAGVQAVTLH